MDAFTVAAELLHGIELSADQLAQLRAVNHKYYSLLLVLTQEPGSSETRDPAGTPRSRTPTAREASELRAMLVEDIRRLLTPEQRRTIDGA